MIVGEEAIVGREEEECHYPERVSIGKIIISRINVTREVGMVATRGTETSNPNSTAHQP